MTSSFLKQATEGNKNAILKQQIIRQYIFSGDSSITDLSRAVNLSVPTVTKLIGELIEEGFVHNFGEQGTAGGRRPNIYGLNPYAGYFVGVEIRTDSVVLAVVNFKGQLLADTTVDFLMDNDPHSLDRLCDIIRGFIDGHKIPHDKVLAVGVNISGRVNSQTGYSYSYFFVEEQPLTVLLGERLGCGPITTAPCSISCLIFASSSGRIVSSCGSTSMRYCVPCGSVILPSCTVMYFSITSAFM